MTNEMIIIDKCIEIFNVEKEEITVVKRLMGGMSNFTYIIKINNQLYTFRSVFI